ncbi:MAG: outer membrane lipoprotein carrier protein LolA [Dehalococcoidaceae bacterium]|nr:outer membrane lipoprotein carrier protein LolA [Dehalococcoidaceae bacterium]
MRNHGLKTAASVLMVLVVCLVMSLSACGGDKPAATSTSQPATSAQPTTSMPGTPATTQPTTQPTTTTQPPITTPTTTAVQTTAPTTTAPTTTSPSTTPPATTQPEESLEDILGGISGIDSIKYDTVVIPPESGEFTTHVWVKGGKMRTESTAEGETVVMILDQDSETMYMYMPEQNMAMKIAFDTSQAEDSVLDETEDITAHNPVIVGTETLDGKVCMVIEYSDTNISYKAWIWKDKGLPVQMIMTTPQGNSTIRYQNYDFGAIDDSVFTIPEGVEIVDMSQLPGVSGS